MFIQRPIEDFCFLLNENLNTRYAGYIDVPYRNFSAKYYTTLDGSIGFGITTDNELISVYALRGFSWRSSSLNLIIPKAVYLTEGDLWLSCFEGFLSNKYAEYGFQIIQRDIWSDELKPSNWRSEDGTPNYVKMRYIK